MWSMSACKGPEWRGGEKRGSGIGGTFPTQPRHGLSLHVRRLVGLLTGRSKALVISVLKLPTPLCERGFVSLGYTWREIPREVFLVYIWCQISKTVHWKLKKGGKKQKNQLEEHSAQPLPPQRVTTTVLVMCLHSSSSSSPHTSPKRFSRLTLHRLVHE